MLVTLLLCCAIGYTDATLVADQAAMRVHADAVLQEFGLPTAVGRSLWQGRAGQGRAGPVLVTCCGAINECSRGRARASVILLPSPPSSFGAALNAGDGVLGFVPCVCYLRMLLAVVGLWVRRRILLFFAC